MGRNTSVSLGDYFEDFVEDRIAKGRYKSASEVIRKVWIAALQKNSILKNI